MKLSLTASSHFYLPYPDSSPVISQSPVFLLLISPHALFGSRLSHYVLRMRSKDREMAGDESVNPHYESYL